MPLVHVDSTLVNFYNFLRNIGHKHSIFPSKYPPEYCLLTKSKKSDLLTIKVSFTKDRENAVTLREFFF